MSKSLLLGLVCLAGLAVNVWIAVNNRTGWGVDFNQFYAASHLAGTGHQYDWEALRKLEVANGGPEVRTGRLPVVAFGMKLLGALPYPVAHWIWFAICAAALLAAALLWPGADRMVMIAALAWSMPATLLLVLGQDTPLWLFFFAAGVWLLDRNKQAPAGVAFALCISKFHLAVAIPVLLVAQKRWTAFAAAAATGAVLLGACFAVEGRDWPRRYLAMVGDPSFSPAHERMPNVRGLAAWLPAAPVPEIAGAAAIVALLWLAARRKGAIGIAGAAAAACGLLLGRHAYANDCTLLIPLAAFVLAGKAPPALKFGAVLVLTPLLTLLLASSRPFFGQLLAVGFVAAALWYERGPAPEREASA
jgi:hypothetical protein